jgi:phosphoesterase RecJ-like protein
MSQTLKKLIEASTTIVVIQADNLDGDSLASALALESMLGDIGKNVIMYSGVEVPGYLRYIDGWDRVVHGLPRNFDMSIVVDTSAIILLESLSKSGELAWLKSKPCAIIDHHQTEPTIDFAEEIIVRPAVATGEIVYSLSKENNWPISKTTSELLAISVLSDSLGLMSEATTSKTIRMIAELVDAGVSLAALDDKRKALQKKSPEILEYKGRLLLRISYSEDGAIAFVHIPWEEIEKYSHQYNPAALVIDEMRMVEEVKIAIVLKSYPGGKVTGKIRANYGFGVADKLAEHFNGGGHKYAAGFKLLDTPNINELQEKCIKIATELLRSNQT